MSTRDLSDRRQTPPDTALTNREAALVLSAFMALGLSLLALLTI